MVDQEHAGVVLVAHRADDGGEVGHLRLGKPAAGSSMSTKRGSVASARATPSRRSSPCASDARRSRRVADASREPLEQLVGATARGSRADAPAPSAATSTFSRTESPRNERLC